MVKLEVKRSNVLQFETEGPDHFVVVLCINIFVIKTYMIWMYKAHVNVVPTAHLGSCRLITKALVRPITSMARYEQKRPSPLSSSKKKRADPGAPVRRIRSLPKQAGESPLKPSHEMADDPTTGGGGGVGDGDRVEDVVVRAEVSVRPSLGLLLLIACGVTRSLCL